jgi:hypothetical protein
MKKVMDDQNDEIDFMKSDYLTDKRKNDTVWTVGAQTSPICAVDIAASTTAVGRGMMQLKTSSKDFGGGGLR